MYVSFQDFYTPIRTYFQLVLHKTMGLWTLNIDVQKFVIYLGN